MLSVMRMGKRSQRMVQQISRITFLLADERDVVTLGMAAVELSLITLVVIDICLRGPASDFVIVAVIVSAVLLVKEM